MLVLPGVVDVHTHTRVASDAEPDRFFQDSVAAAYGGTTSFLSFNNPGTGSSPAAERSLRTGLREWRAATDGDSAIDYGLSLAISGHADDPLAELPATVDGAWERFGARRGSVLERVALSEGARQQIADLFDAALEELR